MHKVGIKLAFLIFKSSDDEFVEQSDDDGSHTAGSCQCGADDLECSCLSAVDASLENARDVEETSTAGGKETETERSKQQPPQFTVRAIVLFFNDYADNYYTPPFKYVLIYTMVQDL